MNKTKLEQVLSDLNKKEIKKFVRFIDSTYFNVNLQLKKLLSYYVKKLSTNSEQLQNNEIWTLIEAKGPFNDVRFRKFQSDLFQLSLKFLAVEQLLVDSTALQKFTIKGVRHRNIKSLESSLFRSIENKFHESSNQSVDDLHTQLEIEKELYLSKYQNERVKASNLPKILSLLDQYYISEKFKFSTVLAIRSKVVSKDSNQFFLDAMIKEIEDLQIPLHPLGRIYKLVLLTQISDQKSEESFLELENTLADINIKLANDEVINIYSSMVNFCITKINRGNKEYLNKLFNTYQSLLSYEQLLEKGKILYSATFKNIVITALRIGKFDWAENFALNYSKYLKGKSKDNLLTFQLGVIYFYKKEFEKVIEILRDFEFKDLLDNLRTKVTLIQTYYELNEFEALDSLLRSLRTYITRHKELDSGRRSNYKNLIKIMSQLIQVIPGDKKKIEKIKNTLADMKGIAVNRAWIEEKIAELEN